MRTQLLVDAIVRQTTVLIAQLSTAAGLRAPLSHVADQVFLQLSKELEEQGLGKRIVADMFGLALRGYQRKVQRLRDKTGESDRSLWEDILRFVQANPVVTRTGVECRFGNDEQANVRSVLNDLVRFGLLSSAGTGTGTVFRLTTDEDRRAILDNSSLETLAPFVWVTVFHHPDSTAEQIAQIVGSDTKAVEQALTDLVAEGRVREQSGTFCSSRIEVPLGSDGGWEAAVFDHFQAVCCALAAKVRMGTFQAEASDVTGGATVRFELCPKHPHLEEATGLLGRVRTEVDALWRRVEAQNKVEPPSPDETLELCFYVGQVLKERDA